MQKILIATTNAGKFHEMISFFNDLHFKFVNLNDIELGNLDAKEPYDTTWENAIEKAKFFAKKSGLITISEDTAFYVRHLDGKPGVKAKRWAETPEESNQKIIRLMKNVPRAKREAYFETHACVYNPSNDVFAVFPGRVDGFITENDKIDFRPGMNYDSIFYYPPLKKNFSELSVAEKNTVSHRGQAAVKIAFYLSKQFSFRQLMVPAAIIVKDRKMFFQKRRDGRKAFSKWEFPGGGVENEEDIIACLKREVKDETGYEVEPLELLPQIMNKTEKKYGYQVFLPVYICKIKSGKLKVEENEVSDYGWFTIKEALKLDFLPLNKEIIQANLHIIKKYSD